MADKLRSPFNNPFSNSKEKGPGKYGAHSSPAVSKPAEYGPGDVPLKFYEDSPALRPSGKSKEFTTGTSVKL